MFRSFALGVALVLAGCGGGGDDEKPQADPICEAGRVVTCPCTGATDTGTQACKSDGSAWGACSCPGSETDPEIQCESPQNQENFLNDERCAAGEIMYGKCERDIVDSGVCTEKPFGMFCCPS